jgi:hypothetical protein
LPAFEYEYPSVTDYGSLAELTATIHPLLHGSRTAYAAGFSAPTTPGGGGGNGPVVVSGPPQTLPGGTSGNGPVVNTGGPLGSVNTNVGSGELGAGGSGGGTPSGGAGSGSPGHLPFTGFAVGVVAAAGAAFTVAGGVMRRVLRRESVD